MELRPIQDFPGYFAGDDGNIYSMMPRGGSKNMVIPKGLRRLRGAPGVDGYQRVYVLRSDGVKLTKKVATLVCSAFHGSRPPGMVVCHGLNGRDDNQSGNLSWGTRSKNQGEDRVRDGTINRGERCIGHKLTEDSVRWILSTVDTKTQTEVGKELGVDQSTISNILSGRSWGWLTGIQHHKQQ